MSELPSSFLMTMLWLWAHKYGVELPHNVEETLEIDHQMGTNF